MGPLPIYTCQTLPPVPSVPARLHSSISRHQPPKKKKLAKTTSTTITIPVCGLRIWTRGTARPKGRATLPLLKKKGGSRRHFSFREWESLKTWFVESWPWQARVNCQAKLLRSGQACISLWCHFVCIKGWGGLEREPLHLQPPDATNDTAGHPALPTAVPPSLGEAGVRLNTHNSVQAHLKIHPCHNRMPTLS